MYSLITQGGGMAKAKDSRRENFDVSPQQLAEIEALQELLEAPSKKDAILLAIHLSLHLASEVRNGNHLFIGDSAGRELRKLVMLGIEKPTINKWTYLVAQSHSWKKQLFVKGRKLAASAVWTALVANDLTVNEAADSWELPVEAIAEIIEYCEANKALLEMEAAEELRRLEEKGIGIGTQAVG
jgi:hypothetical protein